MIKNLLTLLLSFISVFSYSQIKIAGFVKDADTGESLIGATVVEETLTNGTVTNSNGYFSILSNKQNIRVSFVGYQTNHVICSADTLITILLKAGQELEEVSVNGKRFQQFNTTKLSVAELNSIPALGGKPDVLKSLQLMPGIQSQGEGTSLLNVRGGNPGENLYLIDNVPLLYVNHFGGFMSVFNPDMINSMDVYKNGFPSKYGGKISSIMAITQREGNNKEWKGNLGIGITDASFSVEGPLIKDKASIIITGRKTLIDLPLWAYTRFNEGQGASFFYGFHDINGKFTYRPDNKNSFHVNLYQGDDYLRYSDKETGTDYYKSEISNKWGNWMLSGRWSRVIGPRLFVNNTLSTTNYRLKTDRQFILKDETDTTEVNYLNVSKVGDISFRSDWQYKVTMDYDVEFGLKSTAMNHIPNKSVGYDTVQQSFEQIRSYENAVYLSNQIHLFSFIDANIGLRLVNYVNETYTNNFFEPRININAALSSTQAINFSYQKVYQFAHLLFTTGSIMNNEIWVPANEMLDPSSSIQYSAGWKGSFHKNEFDAEINVYHKDLNSLVTYKEGYSNLLGDGGWRNKMETGGSGKSQGIEVLLRKNKGKWKGFIAYTYSKTTRRFEGINKGIEYVFNYDVPHSGSINISRKLSEKWSVSLSWVYQTGLPYTPVLGRQLIPVGKDEYIEGLVYGERNSDRMEDYHRLDIGFTKVKTTKRGRRAEWNYSIYNAYNRANANAYIYARDKESDSYVHWHEFKPFKKYKFSFFPIIPTISYKLYFDGKPKATDNNGNQKKSKFFYSK